MTLDVLVDRPLDELGLLESRHQGGVADLLLGGFVHLDRGVCSGHAVPRYRGYQIDCWAIESGVFFVNGEPKPSFTAVRFPFVGDRTSKRGVRVWGKAPVSGTLAIQRRRGGQWTTIERLQVAAGAVFQDQLSLAGKQVLRGRLAGERSLAWTVRR